MILQQLICRGVANSETWRTLTFIISVIISSLTSAAMLTVKCESAKFV